MVLPGLRPDADYLRYDPGDLGRRVELALALARFRGEMPHQISVDRVYRTYKTENRPRMDS